MEPDPGPSREPEARLAELANALVDGLVAALPGWVEKCVSRVADAWSGDPAGDTVEVPAERLADYLERRQQELTRDLNANVVITHEKDK